MEQRITKGDEERRKNWRQKPEKPKKIRQKKRRKRERKK